MWRLGFFFHEIAFGLLSVFIPLYMVSPAIGGSLVDIGIMTALALLFSIPASFFWGYICDRTRRYKLFILLAFISITVILYLFTLATDVVTFTVLYIVMAVLHVAHEAPKNVLVTEHYSRDEWEKSFAYYEGTTEIGFVIGLLIGVFASALGLTNISTLLLCSGLNLAAFVTSILFIADPIIIFERRLVGIERRIDYTYRGVESSSKLMDGLPSDKGFKEESFLTFGVAIILFSLASSIFFTPLPLFFSQQLGFEPSLIFLIYMLNSGGATLGYFFVGKRAISMDAKKQIRRFIFLRGFLVFILVAAVQFAFEPTLLSGAILIMLGFSYAAYFILMLSLSMSLIPLGKSGIFDVLVGLGGAAGSFLGPYLAEVIGFLPQFLIASVIFFAAFTILKIFS